MRFTAAITICSILALLLVTTAGADVVIPSCPTAPGAPGPGTITDAAIEVRELRIEHAQACAVFADWALYMAQDIRETERLIGWMVGLFGFSVIGTYVVATLRA